MSTNIAKNIKFVEWFIIGLIFAVLFIMPVLFTRIDGEISWINVVKIWKDLSLLLPLLIINHWLFVPKILFRKKYVAYLVCVFGLIALFTFSYYFYDNVLNKKPLNKYNIENKRPEPIEPFAQLLMYSILIAGVDTGLLFTKKWNENEEKKHRLEKENAEIQLNILRNQVSPHFFMNTLNNIYGLIDLDATAAKEAVMKLSKLMRYMLYENENGKVKLSKEFEFIKSYIDLMKLRFADNISVQFIISDITDDFVIPAMLYISYIENAFKYGTSYQQESFINIKFEIANYKLHFTCSNTNFYESNREKAGGLGMKNNHDRLKLLFGNNYLLSVTNDEKLYNISLTIPLT